MRPAASRTRVTVEARAGYRGEETPLRFVWRGVRREVARVAWRERTPSEERFGVVTEEGERFVLLLRSGTWFLRL